MKIFFVSCVCTRDGGEPETFEVAGVDRCFYPARAWIEGYIMLLMNIRLKPI